MSTHAPTHELQSVTNIDTPKADAQPTIDEAAAVSITIAGCGGCGMNLARAFATSKHANVLYFDTSMANSRVGESVNVLCNSSGSGSNRAENARDIERAIPQLPDNELGIANVAIVIYSLAGGSGSVIGPLMTREYLRRGMRVIGVIVAEASSSVGAKNTLNTLKTLTAIAKNNEYYMPFVVLSNDEARGRQAVDEAAIVTINDIIELLTKPVFEIDRNDRLNFLNPTKIVNSQPGMKLLTIDSDKSVPDPKALLGRESTEMVDSLLILQNSGSDLDVPLPPARLKKTGFHVQSGRTIIARVSSDISSIDTIINTVEKMQNSDNAQKHQTLSRLQTQDSDDLFL